MTNKITFSENPDENRNNIDRLAEALHREFGGSITPIIVFEIQKNRAHIITKISPSFNRSEEERPGDYILDELSVPLETPHDIDDLLKTTRREILRYIYDRR